MVRNTGTASVVAWAGGTIAAAVLYLLSVPPILLLTGANTATFGGNRLGSRMEAALDLYSVPYFHVARIPVLKKPMMRCLRWWHHLLKTSP